MLFLTDENVPDAVGQFFKDLGHEVQLARDNFRPGAHDKILVEGCDAIEGSIITWNRKDFENLVGRRPPEGNQQRYRHVGAVYFRCSEPAAIKRLNQLADIIKLELALC